MFGCFMNLRIVRHPPHFSFTPRISENVEEVLLLVVARRTVVWARRKTVAAVRRPAGRVKRAVKAPLREGLTVATTAPPAMVEQAADARITTGFTGAARGRVTVPLKLIVCPAAVIAVVYMRRWSFSARLRDGPSAAT
jgi:hypothetical protein